MISINILGIVRGKGGGGGVIAVCLHLPVRSFNEIAQFDACACKSATLKN